jgi:hypothetical protein
VQEGEGSSMTTTALNKSQFADQEAPGGEKIGRCPSTNMWKRSKQSQVELAVGVDLLVGAYLLLGGAQEIWDLPLNPGGVHVLGLLGAENNLVRGASVSSELGQDRRKKNYIAGNKSYNESSSNKDMKTLLKKIQFIVLLGEVS